MSGKTVRRFATQDDWFNRTHETPVDFEIVVDKHEDRHPKEDAV